MGIKEFFLGDNGGLFRSELRKLTSRSPFSKYLVWKAYDPKTGVYYNGDGTFGLLWECNPLAFAGEKSLSILDGLFRMGLPANSVIQFILYADDYVEPYLQAYKDLKTRPNIVARKAADHYAEYLSEGTKGLKSLSGIPIRNFRLFVAVKFPADIVKGLEDASFIEEIANSVQEKLSGAYLNPRAVPPETLVGWARRFFNDVGSTQNDLYEKNIPINKQIIAASTEIRRKDMNLKIGNKFLRCLTVKTVPEEVHPLQTNELFGGVWGITSDASQISSPFLFSMNIIFENLRMTLDAKCNFVAGQGTIASMAPTLREMQNEYMWAVKEAQKVPFVRIIPTMWIWADTEHKASSMVARAKRVWEGCRYYVQEDPVILVPLFCASLPFGLVNQGPNVEEIDRDFIAPSQSVLPMLPVQADFCGGGKPYMLFTGRKGQLITLDLFDKHANNHNFCIMATSGSGKSFTVNEIAMNMFAAGEKIRIIDIGDSYKKMGKLVGAKYLDFRPNSNICINAFSNVNTDNDENLQGDLEAISAIVFAMCFAKTDSVPTDTAEVDANLIKSAVRWAWENYGHRANIDAVYQYLNGFPTFDKNIDINDSFKIKSTELLMTRAHILAFSLIDFTSTGAFGKWFNGEANFDIANDDFVVLELDHLMGQPALFKVVILQVMNAVTSDLYLSARTPTKRFIIFDESHLFIKDNKAIRDVINQAYRRARKYNGSVGIITQSLLDLKLFGDVGKVIWGNSAFKFLLESEDFEQAKSEKIVNYDDFVFDLLKSVKSNRPYYSELFIDSPFGVGIARLTVPPFKYYVNTSTASEIAEIENLIDSGLSVEEAINEMVRRRAAA